MSQARKLCFLLCTSTELFAKTTYSLVLEVLLRGELDELHVAAVLSGAPYQGVLLADQSVLDELVASSIYSRPNLPSLSINPGVVQRLRVRP